VDPEDYDILEKQLVAAVLQEGAVANKEEAEGMYELGFGSNNGLSKTLDADLVR